MPGKQQSRVFIKRGCKHWENSSSSKSICVVSNLCTCAGSGKYFLKDHTFYLSNCQSNGIVTTYQYRGLPGSPSGLRKVFSSPVKRSLIKDNDQGLGTKRKIRLKNENKV